MLTKAVSDCNSWLARNDERQVLYQRGPSSTGSRNTGAVTKGSSDTVPCDSYGSGDPLEQTESQPQQNLDVRIVRRHSFILSGPLGAKLGPSRTCFW